MQINGQDYYVDFDKLFDWIFDGGKKKNLESEITEAYEKTGKSNKPEMVAKTIREINGEINDTDANIRYDAIKVFLLTALGLNEDMNSVAEDVAFNTLIANKIMKLKD